MNRGACTTMANKAGDLANIVVMQHATKERFQNFLDDLAAAK